MVTARVFTVERRIPPELDRALERDPVRFDVARILCRVEGNVHGFNVYALNRCDVPR